MNLPAPTRPKWVIAFLLWMVTIVAAQPSPPRIEIYASEIRNHPDVLRYYAFDHTSPENGRAESGAGEDEPAIYQAVEPLEIVPGAAPETSAVHLDRGYFQAKAVDFPSRQFTLELRFRKYGQGSLLGNGRTNGMLLALGDGYWSGARIYVTHPGGSLRFEVGRPKPSNAFGLTVPGPLPEAVWHHVAATWDGHRLRLFVDGLACGAADYDGDYYPTAGALRIGYANAGIGSLKMDVDEVAIYGSALPPETIFRHAFFSPGLPAGAMRALQPALTAMADQRWEDAAATCGAILNAAQTSSLVRAVARLGLARSLRRQGKMEATAAQCAALCDDPNAPQSLRELAARHCLPPTHGPVIAVGSSRVYQRLLDLEDVSDEQRPWLRMTLADALLRENQTEAARSQYRHVQANTDAPELLRWNARLQFGHTYLAQHEFDQARQVYRYLSARPNAPASVRGLAMLCVGHTYQRQRNYTAAAEAFAAAAQEPTLLPHHRQEAAERREEMLRLSQGLPARDPAASRIHLPDPPTPGLRFFVSPTGDDHNPGDQQHPFATLDRARDAIRDYKRTNGLPTGGIAVIIRGGQYAVRHTFTLSKEDSGTAEAPIVYQASPGEQPRFSGGEMLSGFSAVKDARVLERLPAETRTQTMQLELPSHGITDYGSIASRGYGASAYPTHPWVDLYVDGSAMQLARWPNDGTVAIGKVFAGGYKTDQSDQPGQFEYTDPRPATWAPSDDIWMFGSWAHLWAGRYVKIAKIDTGQHRITTAQPSSYGYRPGQPYYYLNVLEELDRPGEWYLDRRTGTIYLIPAEPQKRIVAEFPLLSQMFLKLNEVSHVTFRGLRFELARAEGAVVTGGEHVLFHNCTFGKLGANGIVILGGRNHGVLGCSIYSLGAGGVRMAGGEMKTLTPGGHFVENCHIYDFSRVDRVYAPAVHLDGVGLRVSHNLIHDSPHHAIRAEGHEHRIEYNEIHHVVYEFDDQAGIDIYGNPGYRGIQIRYNFWHHIGSGYNVAGQAGIRLDDFISSVLMYGNVFYRSADGRFGAIQIHGGKDNIAENNLFIDCRSAFSFSPWGPSRWGQRLAEERTKASLARAGADRADSPLRQRYPDLNQMEQSADRNFVWRNLVVQCDQFSLRDRGVNELLDNHVLSQDPGFVDAAEQDFSLPGDSAVYDRFGFRPIPFGEIGLYQDEPTP